MAHTHTCRYYTATMGLAHDCGGCFEICNLLIIFVDYMYVLLFKGGLR